eukprot:TRINITY_DN8213_c0_g1_i2.p1 TRINITY_DN8213_c0_g1~~TRINITY_DN8213_c0_g1_i2.p1  ORF type:complete len:300 (-),score=26.63 TRINITY_DN8213_c0_g1_i2:8-886(-)
MAANAQLQRYMWAVLSGEGVYISATFADPTPNDRPYPLGSTPHSKFQSGNVPSNLLKTPYKPKVKPESESPIRNSPVFADTQSPISSSQKFDSGAFKVDPTTSFRHPSFDAGKYERPIVIRSAPSEVPLDVAIEEKYKRQQMEEEKRAQELQKAQIQQQLYEKQQLQHLQQQQASSLTSPQATRPFVEAKSPLYVDSNANRVGSSYRSPPHSLAFPSSGTSPGPSPMEVEVPPTTPLQFSRMPTISPNHFNVTPGGSRMDSGRAPSTPKSPIYKTPQPKQTTLFGGFLSPKR